MNKIKWPALPKIRQTPLTRIAAALLALVLIAGLVLVVEAADGKAEDVANQLAAYQQDQVAFYGNYAEFAQAQDNVENAVIAFKDNTVVMVIASNECTADLDSAVDNALA